MIIPNPNKVSFWNTATPEMMRDYYVSHIIVPGHIFGSETQVLGGVHHNYHFSNGYGASVICHKYSMGVEAMLMVNIGGHLEPVDPEEEHVPIEGYISSEEELRSILIRYASLPPIE